MASIAAILSKIPGHLPFTVKEVPGKGIGVFATRDITKGELVLSEMPLLRITEAHYLAEDVEVAYQKLSNEEKTTYMSLASAHGQDPARYPSRPSPLVEKRERKRILEQHEARTKEEKTVLSVCMTNAMEVDNGAGIFEIASRFNHECVPNACFAWDGRKGVETIYAVRDIAKDEEITLCYCDPFFDVSMRKWELMHYGFECQCRACLDFDKEGTFANESRDRRWRLRELDQQLRLSSTDAERLQIRLQMVATMKAEGLCNPVMATTYLEIARICDRGGDLAIAVKAARKALEIYTVCLGVASEKAEDAAKSVRAFEKQLVDSEGCAEKLMESRP